jgi:uncharacterized membrane protein
MQTEDGIVTPGNTTIRKLDINRGVEWIAGGFKLFMKKPGELILAGLALFVVTIVLNFVPIAGGGLTTMLVVAAAGAMMFACRAIEDGQDLLASAQKAANITPLWILSLIAAGMGIAIALFGFLLAATAVGLAFVSPALAIGLGVLIFLLMTLVSIPIVMAMWLAPGLVVFKGVDPIESIRLSFTASTKNFLPFIIFYVLAVIGFALGGMLMGIGLIFVFPVLLCATYVAYKDMFATASGGEALVNLEKAQ